MNFKLMSVAVSLALSAAAAQEQPEAAASTSEIAVTEVTESTAAPIPEAEPTPSAETPASSPVPETQVASQAVEAPIAEAPNATPAEVVPTAEASSELPAEAVTDSGKANFDILHSRAYNPVGNQAAAVTIADNLAKPHEMHGSKLVYLEPSLEYAAIAFGETNTYFLSFQNTTGNHGLVTAGIATSNFGLEVIAAIGKTWTLRDEPNLDYKSTDVDAGDEIGVIYSMPLGSLDLTVSADWLTTSYETSDESDISTNKVHTENEHDYWDVRAKVSVSNSPKQNKEIAWSAGLEFLRHNKTESSLTKKEIVTKASLDTRFEIAPQFNLGLQILKANNARVFIGANTSLPFAIYDDIENSENYTRRHHISFCIQTSPNILAELAFNDNWMIFGGANYNWNVFATEYLYEADSDINAFAMKSNAVNVDAGVRFHYKNFSVEASLNNTFFNNPLAGFNGNAFVANLGGFINF